MPLSRKQTPPANPLVLPDNSNENGWSLNTLDNGGVGGSISLNGLTSEGGSSNGGSIDLRALYGENSNGGSIISSGNLGYSGGTLNMSAGEDGVGGNINTSNDGGSIDTSLQGGSINTSGGEDGAGGGINTSNGGGSIDTSGDSAGSGGAINTSCGESGSGGSINTSGGDLSGGAINTSDGGGSIDTRGDGSGAGVGGSINTSLGGGSINTRGVGSIQFGAADTRTTLNGSATETRTLTLPDTTGTLLCGLGSQNVPLNFGSITGNGGFADLTLTLTGAQTGETVFVTSVATGGRGATDGQLIFEAFVSATNTVTIRAHNPHNNAINPESYDFRVALIRF